jgi:hypothetical protein
MLIYILYLLKREDMSPFANLFSKHVGNLNERYKLSEATYERFIDKFIELKHQTKRPQIMRNESQVIEAQSLKIAELLTHQEQLQTELNEMKAELNKASLNTSDCQIIEQPEELDNLVEIDTIELVAKVKALAARLRISMQTLANRLNLSKHRMFILFRNTYPWRRLHHQKKIQYSKIKAWYDENEHTNTTTKAVSPRASEQTDNKESKKFRAAQNNLLNADGSLDTVKVSKRLERIIRLRSIDFCGFARWKLHVTKAKFSQLLYQPREWASLSKTDKQAYRRMRKWALASKEKILAMKKSLESRIRLYGRRQL